MRQMRRVPEQLVGARDADVVLVACTVRTNIGHCTMVWCGCVGEGDTSTVPPGEQWPRRGCGGFGDRSAGHIRAVVRGVSLLRAVPTGGGVWRQCARMDSHVADRLANGGSGGQTRAKSRAYKRPSGLQEGCEGVSEGAKVVKVSVV